MVIYFVVVDLRVECFFVIVQRGCVKDSFVAENFDSLDE